MSSEGGSGSQRSGGERRKLYSLLYYVRSDGSPSGEVGLAQANQLMESGNLNGNTFVWADGMEEWAKLCDCKDLFVLDLDDMKLHYETKTCLPSDIVTVREVRSLLAAGEITADTLVWAEGMDEWARLSECHAFFGVEKRLLVASTGAAPAVARVPPPPLANAPGVDRVAARSAPRGTPEPEPEPVVEQPPMLSSPSIEPAAGLGSEAQSKPKSYGTDWMCRQRVPLEKDRVISSLEFDGSGEFIAIGDTGGQVSILRQQPGDKISGAQYQPYFDFPAHEPEFDALKSAEISERVNCVRWAPNHCRGSTLLTSNDKTIKLWRITDTEAPAAVAASFQSAPRQAWGTSREGGGLVIPALGSRPKIGRRAKLRRAFRNAHSYTMNSISCCSDGETFISSDDLRVYLWNMEREDEVFMTLDLKPDNLEDLTEVITTSKFHPDYCYLFGYSNSRGQVKLHDLREGALCGSHSSAKLFHDTSGQGRSDAESLFDELLVSISDLSFGGRQVFVRDLMTVRVWDIAMPREPVRVVDVAQSLRPRLGELWQSERIFDRFEVAVTPSGDEFASGSYGNTCMVVGGNDGESHGWFEAGRQLLQQRAWKGPAPSAKLDQRIMSLSWHPRERLLAVGAENTLYLHSGGVGDVGAE